VSLRRKPSPRRSRNVWVCAAIASRSTGMAAAPSVENQARSSSLSRMRVRPGPADSRGRARNYGIGRRRLCGHARIRCLRYQACRRSPSRNSAGRRTWPLPPIEDGSPRSNSYRVRAPIRRTRRMLATLSSASAGPAPPQPPPRLTRIRASTSNPVYHRSSVA
jgi:hypothetical protein